MKIPFRLCSAASLLVLALQVLAQAMPPDRAPDKAPSTDQMIEQLRTLPKVRGLRNLTVEAAQSAAADRPSLTLSIQFDFDSARIRAESQAPLADLASALASPDLSSSRFLIEGHTDAQGSPDYNRRLSEQRAQAVKALLVGKGVVAARLVATGKGSAEPLHAQSPLSADNRRVKIVNLD